MVEVKAIGELVDDMLKDYQVKRDALKKRFHLWCKLRGVESSDENFDSWLDERREIEGE